jgi:hypothetical protein
MPVLDATIVALATDTSLEDGFVSHYMTVRLLNGVFVKAVITPEAAALLQQQLAPVQAPAPRAAPAPRPMPAQAAQTFIFGGDVQAQEEPQQETEDVLPRLQSAARGVVSHLRAVSPPPEPPVDDDFEQQQGVGPDDDGVQAL